MPFIHKWGQKLDMYFFRSITGKNAKDFILDEELTVAVSISVNRDDP